MSLTASGIARGTHVTTRRGEKPVEALTRSDLLVSMTRASGQIALAPQPPSVAWTSGTAPVPAVRIVAGAFGTGVPVRDLSVRPGQALLVGDVLVPALRLVNGATIRREHVAASFTPVGFPAPALLMAEGVYAASAGAEAAEKTGHALADDGSALLSARRTLFDRLRGCGYAPAGDPGLVLESCGDVFGGTRLDDTTWRFTLPRPASAAWLRSCCRVPDEAAPEGGDRRRLGVMVEAIALDRVPVALDAAALAEGWHAREQDARMTWRWTDGAARLPDGFRSLVVKLAAFESAWLAPDGEAITPEVPWADVAEPPDVEAGDADHAIIAESGLVDAAWYVREYADVAASGLDPVLHFADRGWAERRRPNAYFDPDWYVREHRTEIAAERNPLLHYIEQGERAGLRPIAWFDPDWYRRVNRLAEGESPLRHWLAHRHTTRFSPVPEFDVGYYCWAGRDMPGSALDPFEHYLAQGWKEGRNPSPGFETAYYARRYEWVIAGEHPFLHYLRNRGRMTLQTNVRDGVRHDVVAAARAGQRMFAFPFVWYLGNWAGHEPLVAFATDPTLEQTFCIVWKNERLAGESGPESLLAEALRAYRYETENDGFIVAKMAHFFADRRYLRRDGRPVVLFELPEPNLDATLAAARWTNRMTREHGTTPLFVMTERSL